MAVEKVVMYQNTSVLHDEILAHRFGLLPVLADPDLFDLREESEPFAENNTIKFYLNVKCVRKPGQSEESAEQLSHADRLDNHLVLAAHVHWEPLGEQATRLSSRPPRILHDQILLCKLAEGQEIEAELYATKGVGKTHTKWSPVCTAFYRLFPSVRIAEPVTGADAEEIKALCPTGVFDIEDVGSGKARQKRLTVASEERCTTCRACVGHELLGSRFELGKRPNRYHFTVESVGVLPPTVIFGKALEVLREKATYYQSFLAKPAN
jgi:DNA-directed RNA polymerase I and III subunit RPAC1